MPASAEHNIQVRRFEFGAISKFELNFRGNSKNGCSRYSEELSAYKYAGYGQLIKTIDMEAKDDKLFQEVL